jgi:deoxyhypusine synthase
VVAVAERGRDYFPRVTDVRPGSGRLSGATPNEAVSWGKLDPDKPPDTVVFYVDPTVALPIITAYAMARRKPRTPRRLYEQRDQMIQEMTNAYEKVRLNRARNKAS